MAKRNRAESNAAANRRRRQAGYHRVDVWFSPETQEQLKRLQEATATRTASKTIAAAIASYAKVIEEALG